MARYSAKHKSTIVAYKKQRKRVMNIIKDLKKWGVQVPESVVPKQGGHITMKDVHKLEKITSEKIAKKSIIVTTTERDLHTKGKGRIEQKKTVIAKGSDVIKEVRKAKGIARHKLREARKKGLIKRDPVTGYEYNVETGEIIKGSKRRKKKTDYSDTGFNGGLKEDEKPKDNDYDYDDDNDYGFDDEDFDIPALDVDKEYVDSILHEIDKYQNARSAIWYIREAIEQLGYGSVADALKNMEESGYSPYTVLWYSDEEVEEFLNYLSEELPLEGRYDFDIENNDSESYSSNYDEDEYYYEDEEE